MPKRVDHEERRRQIADALLRTAAARGLHATGMREVAAEAGVSLRLVQYYFGTKEELMLAAMQHLAARFSERALARITRITEAGNPVNPRDVIAAILAGALPADDERRTFIVLYTAYFALSLTEPALAIDPLVRNSDAVIDVVAAQLRAGQAASNTPAGLDPDLEAVSLLAMSAGLGTSVLGSQSSPEQAQAVIDYHLDRLFPASPPALPSALTPTTTTDRVSSPGSSAALHDAVFLGFNRPAPGRRVWDLPARRAGAGSCPWTLAYPVTLATIWAARSRTATLVCWETCRRIWKASVSPQRDWAMMMPLACSITGMVRSRAASWVYAGGCAGSGCAAWACRPARL